MGSNLGGLDVKTTALDYQDFERDSTKAEFVKENFFLKFYHIIGPNLNV